MGCGICGRTTGDSPAAHHLRVVRASDVFHCHRHLYRQEKLGDRQ